MTVDTTEARVVRLTNLLVASSVLLICLGGEIHWEWAGSPPPRKPDSFSALRGIMMYSVAFTWFAGAIGLVYRKRSAWAASLVGAGFVAGFFVCALIELVWLWYHPNADLARLQNLTSGPTGAISYIFALGAIGAFLSIAAVIAALLFIGLCLTRKQLLREADQPDLNAL